MIRALDIWLPDYLRGLARHPRRNGVTDVLFCLCDHFEPLHGTDRAGAIDRLRQWQREYPRRTREFRDADGVAPRHTFFYPIEQYDPDLLDRLSAICAETGSEIEVHLHHDRDTPAGLRSKLERGKEALAGHGALPIDSAGQRRFGFIHGNWALADSHPDGRACGVRNELTVLREAGCYADFTLPSAPERTQTRLVNQIYYASSTGAPKPHDTGIRSRAGQGATPPGELLLVQGPLALNWRRRKFGLLPRIENGEISGGNPPLPDRLRLWLDTAIHVEGQPGWIFIKLHTHGGIPRNMKTLLGDAMSQFYEYMLKELSLTHGFRLHFVTAREMANAVHAAEDGHTGDAGNFRDYRYNLASGA